MIAFTKGKVIGYLVAIFVAGVLAGGVGGYSVARQQQRSRPHGPPPKDMVQHTVERLESRLGLTPDQVSRIRTVVEQSFAKMDKQNKEHWEHGRDCIREMNAQIVSHLTPEQKEEFDRMERERREKMRGWGRPPGSPGGKSGTNNPSSDRRRPPGP